MRMAFKSLFIFLFLIIWNISSLSAGEIIDTKFSEITETNNIEYNGEVVKLSFSGVRPIAGNSTNGCVVDKGYPAFASNWVCDPTVIKDGAMYKMWFQGFDGSYHRIGYAYSYDGINWTVVSNESGTKGCVVDNGYPAFASSRAAAPTVIKDGTMYKMWFSGSDGSIFRIGYAYSYDGINWTVYSNTASGMKGAVIGPENSPAFASKWVYGPTVIKDDTIYKMWFYGSDGSYYRIGYAYSYDGINWTVVSNESGTKGCMLDKGYPAFASKWVYGPTVIKDGTIYKIWFSGYDSSTYRIGYGIITFNQSGYFVSRIIDIGFAANLDKIYFYGDIKSDTYIKFQIRAGATISELNSSQFTGPGNATDTYYTYNGQEIENITNVRYIQYKAYLLTDNDYYSPELSRVKFTYTSLYESKREDERLYTFPNPYIPSEGDLSIRYSLEEPVEVEIKIYTPEGREIWSKTTKGEEGWNIVKWDGRDNNGRKMGSGVYFCVIKKKYRGEEKFVRNTILLVK